MAKYVEAYKILNEECIKFCEDHNAFYGDIIAEIYTDVLGHDFVYCMCSDNVNEFEFITDWYEGGELTIISMDYFENVCDKAFHKKK